MAGKFLQVNIVTMRAPWSKIGNWLCSVLLKQQQKIDKYRKLLCLAGRTFNTLFGYVCRIQSR